MFTDYHSWNVLSFCNLYILSNYMDVLRYWYDRRCTFIHPWAPLIVYVRAKCRATVCSTLSLSLSIHILIYSNQLMSVSNVYMAVCFIAISVTPSNIDYIIPSFCVIRTLSEAPCGTFSSLWLATRLFVVLMYLV